jgi:hypothetical protein
LPLGSHHCLGSQAKGRGPTPSGKQVLLNGSQYCPGSHCAELTAGVPSVVSAIAIATSVTTAANLPARFRIADSSGRM